MHSTRRGFLGALAAVAAGLMLDPDLALWVPGAKTIFLPPAKPSLVTSQSLARGDIFTIKGFYALNPVTGLSTGALQSFIITADVSSGDVDLSAVCPRIIPDGPYRNVNAFTGRNRITPVLTGKEIPCSVEWVHA